MKKKIKFVGLALCMLTGCGKNADVSDTKENKKIDESKIKIDEDHISGVTDEEMGNGFSYKLDGKGKIDLSNEDIGRYDYEYKVIVFNDTNKDWDYWSIYGACYDADNNELFETFKGGLGLKKNTKQNITMDLQGIHEKEDYEVIKTIDHCDIQSILVGDYDDEEE